MKALLIIDMQEVYIEKYDKALIARVNERIQEACGNNELLIYIKNLRRLKSGDTSYDFAEGLEIRSENIFYKAQSSIFTNHEFLRLLKENCVTEIEAVGIDGSCCVAASALGAVKAGFVGVLNCKYTGVQNAERFEKKKALLRKSGVVLI